MLKKLLVLSLISSLASAQVLEKIITEKGYVLSLDLQKKECKKIWTEQLPLFMKKNPSVKNPDILQIGQELLVQNCQAPAVAEVNPKIAPEISPAKPKEPKKESSPFFLGISGIYHGAAKKDGDAQKQTTGYQIVMGKYFKLNKNELKASLGLMRTKSKYDATYTKDLTIEKAMLSLDVAYLYSVGSKIKLGPDLGLLYSEMGTQFKDPLKTEQNTSMFLGLNAVYDLSKHFAIDFKINNQLENRLNVMSSLGIELKF